MPNNFFRFKEFTVYQSRSSMKVCTDACIFGAYIAKCFSNDSRLKINSCLDVGTGTGLLSLMFAQKNKNVKIDAVEIETKAFIDAKENFSNSLFTDRLHVFKADIKSFNAEKKYDLIICNPPFFENDLLSIQKNKNLAKHSAGLTLGELSITISKQIAVEGFLAVLLPFSRMEYFKNLCYENKFFLHQLLLVKQSPHHNYFRAILIYGKKESEIIKEEITIKNNDGSYSEAFIELLKEYYLKL